MNPNTAVEATPELGDALDSFDFSAASDTTATDTTATEDTTQDLPEEDAPDESADLPVEDGEVEAEDPAESVEEDEEWSDEEAEKLAATQDGKNRIVSKKRFDHLYSTYKQARALKNALGGQLPSVEEIQSFTKAYSMNAAMLADIESGDLDRVGRFVSHWSKKSEDALPQLVDRSIDQLRNSRPEQYDVLRNHFAEEIIDTLYADAAKLKASNDPQYKAFLYGVQRLDYHRNQRYRTDADITAPDPVDERLEQIARFEETQRSREETQRRDTAATFQRTVSTELDTARTAGVEDALKPIAESYGQRPRLFAAITKDLMAQAAEAVEKDSLFQAKYRPLIEKAERTLSAELRTQAVAAYKDRFNRAVKQLRPAVIKEATAAAVAANKAQRDKAAASAAKREPSGGGKPASPVVVNQRYKEAADRRDMFAAIDAIASSV